MTRPGVYRLVSTALWDANPVSAQSTIPKPGTRPARAVGQPAYHRGYPYPYPYRKYHTRRLAVCSSTACVGCGVRDADCGNGNCEVGEACTAGVTPCTTAALCAADCPVVAAALRCQPAEVGSGGKPTQVRAVMPQLLHSGWHELGFQHPART